MSTPRSWSRGGRRQVDEVGWSRKVMEMGQGTDKDEKGKKGGHTMTVCPSVFWVCGSGQSQTWRGTGTIMPGSGSVCGPLRNKTSSYDLCGSQTSDWTP